jgi:hypothetical protein
MKPSRGEKPPTLSSSTSQALRSEHSCGARRRQRRRQQWMRECAPWAAGGRRVLKRDVWRALAWSRTRLWALLVAAPPRARLSAARRQPRRTCLCAHADTRAERLAASRTIRSTRRPPWGAMWPVPLVEGSLGGGQQREAGEGGAHGAVLRASRRTGAPCACTCGGIAVLPAPFRLRPPLTWRRAARPPAAPR